MRRYASCIPLAFCLLAGKLLHADTPIYNDTTTQYTIPVQNGSAPCWGTCDLAPSYNNYVVPSEFTITKITFSWSDNGGNNCDQLGHYGAIISSFGGVAGAIATSTNNIYMGCGGTNGPGELDFAGQTVPASFYLDFASIDGGLQGGASITVSNVEIWGSWVGQRTGLPVLFVHGICDKPDSFLPAEAAVKTYLQQQLPDLYPDLTQLSPPLLNEYVVLFNGTNVQFQQQGSITSSYSTSQIVDPRTRFFLVDFNDSLSSDNLYQEIDQKTSLVASISIPEKAFELSEIIWRIKAITGAPRVIVVGHSMGGLDTRSYIEEIGSPAVPYFNDIAALITLDTPHGGSETASLSIIWTGTGSCAAEPSTDKSEMDPFSSQSIIPEINYAAGTASPLPPALTITSITSTWSIATPLSLPLSGPDDDNVLYGSAFDTAGNEQDLGSVSGIENHSQSSLVAQPNVFGNSELSVNSCGVTNQLHLLSCTGSAPQSFTLIENAVSPVSAAFSGLFQITPAAPTVAPGAMIPFLALGASPAIWSILEGSPGGTINANTGEYTAPTFFGNAGAVFHVIAINGANPNQYGVASVTVSPSQALLTSPAPGGTFAGPKTTFTWTTVASASYTLWLGTDGIGSNNLWESGAMTGSSVTFGGLPTNGATIYVRLITTVNGTTTKSDYTYTAALQAVLTSPAPGSALVGNSVTFTWTAGSGPTMYDLYLGTAGVGSSNLYSSGHITTTSATVSNIPTNGATIYARLLSYINGAWQYADYTYTESSLAALTSPTPGSTFAGTSVTFTWTSGAGVADYDLYLGTTGVGSNNLYQTGHITATSATVTNLPSNGATIYARLLSYINGAWQYADYTFTESSLAQLKTPASGSVLTGSTVTFTWTAGAGVTEYDLYLGTTGVGSNNLYQTGHITANSAAVYNLPTTGATIYARLLSYINGVWQYVDYTYSEATLAGSAAVLTSPEPGSLLPAGSNVTFAWTAGTNVTEYDLYLGTTGVGSNNLYTSGHITATFATASTVAANGGTIYARLLSYINGAWVYNDYTYTYSGKPILLNLPPAGGPSK